MLLSTVKREWLNEYSRIRRVWTGKFPTEENPMKFSWLESAFMSLLLFLRSLSLHRAYFLLPEPAQSEASELYVLSWLVALVWVLWHPIGSILLVSLIVGYRLVEGINYRLCIVFVDRHEPGWGLRSLNRSLLLLLINYAEIVIGFASLYWATGSFTPELCTASDDLLAG